MNDNSMSESMDNERKPLMEITEDNKYKISPDK